MPGPSASRSSRSQASDRARPAAVTASPRRGPASGMSGRRRRISLRPSATKPARPTVGTWTRPISSWSMSRWIRSTPSGSAGPGLSPKTRNTGMPAARSTSYPARIGRDLGRKAGKRPPPQRVVRRHGRPRRERLAEHRGPQPVGERDRGRRGPLVDHPVAQEERGGARRREHLGGALERRGVVRAAQDRHPHRRVRRGADQHVHRQREHDRAARMRRRRGDRALRELLEVAVLTDLPRVLRDRPRQLHELTTEERRLVEELGDLLTDGHQERHPGARGVEDPRHRVREPGLYVHVDDPQPVALLRVAVRHAQHGRLVQPQHVPDPVLARERVHERQLRRAGVAEHHVHALVRQPREQPVGGVAHASGAMVRPASRNCSQ